MHHAARLIPSPSPLPGPSQGLNTEKKAALIEHRGIDTKPVGSIHPDPVEFKEF